MHILLQIETNPVKIRPQYFHSAEKKDYRDRVTKEQHSTRGGGGERSDASSRFIL